MDKYREVTIVLRVRAEDLGRCLDYNRQRAEELAEASAIGGDLYQVGARTGAVGSLPDVELESLSVRDVSEYST